MSGGFTLISTVLFAWIELPKTTSIHSWVVFGIAIACGFASVFLSGITYFIKPKVK
jgi:hypothetical protein